MPKKKTLILFSPETELPGIQILSEPFWTTKHKSISTSRYRIRFSCGHTDILNHKRIRERLNANPPQTICIPCNKKSNRPHIPTIEEESIICREAEKALALFNKRITQRRIPQNV